MDEAVAHCTRGPRDLGLGEQRRRRASPTSCWLRGRRPDARDARRRRAPARAPARAEGAGRQRRRPDAPAARVRAPARPVRRRVRRALHRRPAGDLRLPRLPVADPPAHLPPHATTRNLHVRGYKEEGTTTTPFDMVMLNDLDRFHLVMDVIDRVPGLGERAAGAAPADGRRAPARTARTRASTATTRPRSATGRGRRAPGRAGARATCASSSSTPARAASSCALLDGDDALLGERELDAPGRRSTRTLRAALARAAGRRRRGRAPDRPRRRALHAAPVVDRRRGRARALARADRRSRRCTSRRRSRRSTRVATRAAGRAGGRLLRHRVPRDAAAGGARPTRCRASGASAGRCAATASTGSRTPTRRGAPRAARRPPDALRIVTCHLGAGASLCAVRDGRSVDTTMGFTPLDGLVMATRSGSRRPGPAALAAASTTG